MSSQLSTFKENEAPSQIVKQAELIISRFCHSLLIVTQSIVHPDLYRNYRSFMSMSGFSEEDQFTTMGNKQTELESILLAKCFVCVSRINMFAPYLGRDMMRNLECTTLYFLNAIFEFLSDDVCHNATENGRFFLSQSSLRTILSSFSSLPSRTYSKRWRVSSS